jgi:hypothetical protein
MCAETGKELFKVLIAVRVLSPETFLEAFKGHKHHTGRHDVTSQKM